MRKRGQNSKDEVSSLQLMPSQQRTEDRNLKPEGRERPAEAQWKYQKLKNMS